MNAALGRNVGLVSIGVLVLAPLGYRLHVLPLRVALLMVPAAALVGAAAIVVGIVMLLRSPAERRRTLVAFATGAVPVVFMASVLASSRGLPMIHDVTTDTHDPPAFVAAPAQRRDALNSLDYDPANAPLQVAAFPGVHGIKTTEDLPHAFEHAKHTVNALGWEIYSEDPLAGRIEAVDTTLLFGFKDDVVIRIRAGVVDLRSVSRVGHGDMGANAKRIEKFIQAYGA